MAREQKESDYFYEVATTRYKEGGEANGRFTSSGDTVDEVLADIQLQLERMTKTDKTSGKKNIYEPELPREVYKGSTADEDVKSDTSAS